MILAKIGSSEIWFEEIHLLVRSKSHIWPNILIPLFAEALVLHFQDKWTLFNSEEFSHE